MRKRFDTPEAERIDAEPGPNESSVRPKGEAYSGRVLVIDDSPDARSVIATVLRFHGFDVVEAQDGEEGLAFYDALHSAIDAVVLDMQMPGMDGTATFRELRRMNPAIKVVLCSGGFPSLQLDADVRAGVLGLLPKPFDLEKLIETVVNAIGKDRRR